MKIQSSRDGLGLMMVLLGSTAIGLVASNARAEEQLPAVSAPNYKISAGGGTLSQEPLYYVEGSVALPVLDQYGLQVDTLVGALDGDGFVGGAGHVFWRDPSIALVGLYGSGLVSTAGSNYTVGNIGAEGALYLGQFAVEGVVGGQFGEEIDTDVFGSAQLAVYPIDDLRLYAGYRYWFSESSGAAGFEWQLPGQNDNSMNFAFYADARFRDDDEVMAFGGVRIYFGEQKSLIRRHREDDPGPLLPDDLFIIEQLLAAPAASAPPPTDGLICPPGSVFFDGDCVISDGFVQDGLEMVVPTQPQG